ncbi:MAG: hypothetical protein ACRDJU_07815 [Actinomycetota bacterium]
MSGSVTSRKSPGLRTTPGGKWQARYYDPAGKLRGKTFVRKTDALAFLAAVKTDVRRGTWIDPGQSVILFQERAGLWADHKLNLRRSTRSRDMGCLRNHVLPTFSSMQVGRIDRPAVQAWVKQLSDSGLSAETVRRCYRILGAILSDAVEARAIPESPCRRISLPRIEHREQLYLTGVEVERLVACLPRGVPGTHLLRRVPRLPLGRARRPQAGEPGPDRPAGEDRRVAGGGGRQDADLRRGDQEPGQPAGCSPCRRSWRRS